MDWTLIFNHAVGTAIGAIGAYIGMRIDMAIFKTSLEALRERLALAERSIARAHDRIDNFTGGRNQ